MVDFNPAIQKILLLVDDDAHQLELRALVLKMSGFTVLTAGRAVEAISLLADSARKVDVAVLDYEMPVMNGCILADYLRAHHPDLQIILYSAAVTIPEDKMGSVDVFVPKCNGVQPLLAQISQLTRVRQPRNRVPGREPYASSSGHSSF
jgi:two-component system, cell cycle sensor histidine kinase and response regulator CckA